MNRNDNRLTHWIDTPGFTVLEVIVVIAMVIVLMSALVPRFLNSYIEGGNQTADDARDIQHLFETGRQYALANREGDNWGIHIVDNDDATCGTGSGSVDSTWYNASWTYRKAITINHAHVYSTESDFPVLIKESSDANLASFAQDDSDDILFTSSDGVTKLSHEIENFNGSTGEIEAWVKVNISSAADTVIYMYYGNADAAAQENENGTWTSDYRGVWHMSEAPTGTVNESTSNANDVVSAGTMTSGDLVAAKIGSGIDFDGSDDYLYKTTTSNLDITTDITVSAWVKRTAADDYGGLLSKTDGSTYWDYDLNFSYVNNIQFYSDPFGYYDSSGTVTDTSGFHKIDFTRSGTNAVFYIDGSPAGNPTISGSMSNTGSELHIGTDGPGWDGQSMFYGIMDEVRVSNVAKNAQWIHTEYDNQNDPSTFLTFGSQGVTSASPSTTDCVILYKGKVFATRDSAYDTVVTLRANNYLTSLQNTDYYFERLSGFLRNTYGFPPNPQVYFSSEDFDTRFYVDFGLYYTDTVFDISGNNNDGTVTNVLQPAFAPTVNTTSGGARGEGSIGFAGLGEGIQLPSTILGHQRTTGFTYALEIQPTLWGTAWAVIGGSPSAVADFRSGGMWIDSSGVLKGTCYDTSLKTAVLPYALASGDFHHVALTYDPSLGSNNLKMYVDGDIAAQTYCDPATMSEGMTYSFIGISPDYSMQYQGMMDEMLIYDRVLSAADIRNLSVYSRPTTTNAVINSYLYIANGIATSTIEFNSDGFAMVY